MHVKLCDDIIVVRFQAFAGKLEGYDAADIRVLLDRALHAALRRSISSTAAPRNGAPGPCLVLFLLTAARRFRERQASFEATLSWCTMQPTHLRVWLKTISITCRGKGTSGQQDTGAVHTSDTGLRWLRGQTPSPVASWRLPGRRGWYERKRAMLCCAGKLEIGQKDMEVALSGFSPASSWGVGRASAGDGPGPRGWQDVGGLEDVREALQETLELPTRYAKLIAKCFHILLGQSTGSQVTLLGMQLE